MTASVSKARHSYGTTLSIDPAGGTSFAAAAEVLDIDGPGIKVTKSKRTNLLSPNKFEEVITGFIDPGSIKAKLNFTEAQYALFLTMLGVNVMSIQITFPLTGAQTVAATLTGKGQIGELGPAVPEDGTITMDVTIEASGPWTFVPGTPAV